MDIIGTLIYTDGLGNKSKQGVRIKALGKYYDLSFELCDKYNVSIPLSLKEIEVIDSNGVLMSVEEVKGKLVVIKNEVDSNFIMLYLEILIQFVVLKLSIVVSQYM